MDLSLADRERRRNDTSPLRGHQSVVQSVSLLQQRYECYGGDAFHRQPNGTHKNVISDRPAKVPVVIDVMAFLSRSLKRGNAKTATADEEKPARVVSRQIRIGERRVYIHQVS